MKNLEDFSTNYLDLFESVSFLEYLTYMKTLQTKLKDTSVYYDKSTLPNSYKRGTRESLFIDLNFNEEQLQDLLIKYPVLDKKMDNIPGWSDMVDKYHEHYKSIILKKINSAVYTSSKDKFGVDEFVIINMFFDFIIHNILINVNEHYSCVFEISDFDKFYAFNERITLGLSITSYFSKNDKNYHKVQYRPHLFSDVQYKISFQTMELFVKAIYTSFSKELFLAEYAHLTRENREEFYQILENNKHPLYSYLNKFISEQALIENHFNIMNEHKSVAVVKKKLKLFKKVTSEIQPVKTIEESKVKELLKHDSLMSFGNILLNIEMMVTMSIRLDEKHGLYMQKLLKHDLRTIVDSFAQSDFSVDEQKIIIEDLQEKYQSFYKIIQLITAKDEQDFSIIKEKQLQDLRELIKL